jgi:hypothetical protein
VVRKDLQNGEPGVELERKRHGGEGPSVCSWMLELLQVFSSKSGSLSWWSGSSGKSAFLARKEWEFDTQRGHRHFFFHTFGLRLFGMAGRLSLELVQEVRTQARTDLHCGPGGNVPDKVVSGVEGALHR